MIYKKMTGNTEMIPEVFLAPQFFPKPLIEIVCKIKYLMGKEGYQVQEKEVHREVFLTVTIVMFYVISVKLQTDRLWNR